VNKFIFAETKPNNMGNELPIFDLSTAYKKEINNGFINTIWLEDDNWDSTLGVSDDNTEVSLQTAGKALIEFANGKRILITNSEWCSLYIID
jgi:hypothetical protein